jgi:capsid protein
MMNRPRAHLQARLPARLPPAAAAADTRYLSVSGSWPASYYDAAATARDNDWGIWQSGPFEDYHFTGSTRATVLARFRREVRNNPYLAGLVAKYPEAIGNTALRSRTSSRAYNLAKERFWFRWSRRCSVDGRSLRKIERIILTELLLAGEVFFVLLANGRIQPVASEFCGSTVMAKQPSEREVNGIVYDDRSRPVAYRFGRLGPWGSVTFTGEDSELVDARYVIHVFDSDRVLLGRGLPWLLASCKTARDLYEISRSKVKQIKDVTAISGAVEKEGAEEYLQSLGEPEETYPGTDAGETVASAADKLPTTGRPLRIELSPGTFVFLEPGEKIHQLVNDYKATDYKELVMLMLHAVSSPVGLPVELWFSGLGDVNYSGFKGLGVQWKSRREYVCDFLEEAFHDRLQFWRVSKAAKEGDIVDIATGAPVANPDGDEELIEWGWKRAAVLDDERAARSNQIRLETGEISHADVWAENGEFPEEVFEKRRQLYLEMLKKSGELAEDDDLSAVEVPVAFLLYNELPGRAAPPPPAPVAVPAPDPSDRSDPSEDPPDDEPPATAEDEDSDSDEAPPSAASGNHQS